MAEARGLKKIKHLSGRDENPVRSFSFSDKRLVTRLLLDRVSSWVVLSGGWLVIASVFAILLVISLEVVPLFIPPSTSVAVHGEIAGGSSERKINYDSLLVDEYLEKSIVLSSSGEIFSFPLSPGANNSQKLIQLSNADTAAASAVFDKSGSIAFGLTNGEVRLAKATFKSKFKNGKREIAASASPGETFLVDEQRRPLSKVSYVMTSKGPVIAAQASPRELIVFASLEKRSLMGPKTSTQVRYEISLAEAGEISAFVLDSQASRLFVGTSSGELFCYQLGTLKKAPEVLFSQRLGRDSISVLGLLLGEQTLITGFDNGAVHSWLWKNAASSESAASGLVSKSVYESHAQPVRYFSRSQRNKGFLTGDKSGEVKLHYGTSGETLLSVSMGRGLEDVILAPKANAIVGLKSSGEYSVWDLDNPHPEVTLKTLFGKVLYEGYEEPQYAWQSSGASDRFESKMSIVPLLFGTIKGTVYALIFAIPLAILGALYTSQFMHPSVKNVVKPVIELMAALPSVVIGFIAGLWLAPRLENYLFGVFLFPILLPTVIIVGLLLWRLLPETFIARFRSGMEIIPLFAVVAFGFWLSFAIGSVLEARLAAGDLQGWLRESFGVIYDQRNSIIVGIAMGFAVIPIIFTITEDCLSSVPKRLVAASLALGATRWQTALRVVLPSASPGVFSAVMIGFGRAVGETMIVLMATGNTPVLDWSIFNGLRAMSANIAVELPEAPHGGSLYRVLFLTALLLFMITFVVNMVSELVRLRLRRKYEVEL